MKKKLLKKELLKKLALSKETLRNLESSDLRDAVGGATYAPCSTNCDTRGWCASHYC
ncbi:MAG TPA: hypothetical protein VNM67_04170 [Thermoanaerobaculia bacterium]|jgi:hypothetical protein|nr:hypothetical protein [Thermoanaerobaculia bacterium]